jgi:NADH:ubiquinone oxidoreductase subunit F (NADH-binding)
VADYRGTGGFGGPTIINNVETFCNVPHILREGAEAFAAMGTATSKGISLREIIFDVGGGIPGGKAFKAVQSGGLVVMDEDTCMVDVAKYFLSFTTRSPAANASPAAKAPAACTRSWK